MKNFVVAILEPSPALGQGLANLIGGRDSGFDVVGIYRDFTSYRKERKTVPEIILVNPLLVDFHDTVINCLPYKKAYPILVAIPYGYINPEALKGYDGELNLFDDGERLTRQLHDIVENTTSGNQVKQMECELTKREKEILLSVAQGMTNREISHKLNLSKNTIATYRNKISAKLNIRGVAKLCSYVRQCGLLTN